MATTIRQEAYFTKQITADTYTIPDAAQFTKFCIKSLLSSAGNGTVIGSLTVDGVVASALTIEPGESISFVCDVNSKVVGITVTAPAGVTIQILGAG